MTQKPEGRGIQSIEVGGRLLSALVDASRPMMLRDLAAAAALTPAQAHAYLASFRTLALVDQDPATGRYQLGHFAMHLGMARLDSDAVLRRASAAAATLADRHGFMMALVVWGPDAPTVVQVFEGAHAVSANVRQGTLFSVSGTATGRLYAAFHKPEALVRRRIEAELSGRARRMGVNAPLSPAALEAEIAAVRARGYATIEDAPVPGVSAIAAPVFDPQGGLTAALTLIGPTRAVGLGPDSPTLRLLRDAIAAIAPDPPAFHDRPGGGDGG